MLSQMLAIRAALPRSLRGVRLLHAPSSWVSKMTESFDLNMVRACTDAPCCHQRMLEPNASVSPGCQLTFANDASLGCYPVALISQAPYVSVPVGLFDQRIGCKPKQQKKWKTKWEGKWRKIRMSILRETSRETIWPQKKLDRGHKTPGWDRSGAPGHERVDVDNYLKR